MISECCESDYISSVKNVLFVAYHFPPSAEVGALRTQKFVKYLPETGWTPYVLTVRDKYYPNKDFARLQDVEGIEVCRTAFWRTPLQFAASIKKFLTQKFAQSCSADAVEQPRSETEIIKQMSYFKRFIVSLNWLPDDKLYWLLPGLYNGWCLIRKKNIAMIVVSAPPHSSIILAYLLSKLTKKKLIVDFRDPWILPHDGQDESFKPKILQQIECFVQDLVLKHASGVVVTNDFFKAALLASHSFLSGNKVHVVHNGFDSNDFPVSQVRQRPEKFIISYIGTFYLQRTPEIFFAALREFISELQLSSNDVEVRLVGDTNNAVGQSVASMIQKNGLESVVTLIGKVAYSRALELMCSSSVLLLLAPNQPYQIPAKTYEYMATGRPVLVLAEDGATASLVEQMGCGIAVSPDDVLRIKESLHLLYDDFRNKDMHFTCDASRFERCKQTHVLAGVLGEVDA